MGVPSVVGSERDGRRDPVPFLVAAAMGTLVSVAFVPGYVMALGGTMWLGVAGAGLIAVGFTAFVYRRMGSTRRDVRRELPPETRLRTIVYGVLVACAAMLGLSLLYVLA